MATVGGVVEGDLQELVDVLESHVAKIKELSTEVVNLRAVNSGLMIDNENLKKENDNLRHELHVLATAYSGVTASSDVKVELADAKPKVPHTLRDHYTLGEKLGEGGFSIVKAGRARADGARVAVKIIKRANLKPDDLTALHAEVQTMRKLEHPHIVRAYDFFDEQDYLYVVMECVEGGELFDRIVKKTCYNEQEARDLVKVVLNTLKYLHSKNIIHRDLKPENLLLKSKDDDSNIKLADFGFATEVNGFNITTQCGTPGYIAPEILRKTPYGKPVDMWSFGVILFILLGGYPPFHHDNQRELFKKIMRGAYEFHPDYWGSVSQDAKNLIRGLLNVDPHERLTVEQALAHPWLTKAGDELAAHNLNENLGHLRKFQNLRKLRAGVKAIMAVGKMKNLLKAKNNAEIQKVTEDLVVEEVKLPHTMKDCYTLGAKLGEGGFSIVKEGFHNLTKEKVAVKIIKRDGMKPEEVVALKKEMRILQQLEHDNIVRAIDFFEEPDNFYVVMECIEGGELFDRIVAKTYYNEQEARDLVCLLLNVIQYMHSQNIIHRDLKPENLLLTSKDDDANIKLADFGFATEVDGNNCKKQVGTPGYIAPEIIQNQLYGKAVDMWSFGVILYILLGGYPPFHDDNQQMLFKKIVAGAFEFHADYWSAVSDDAKDLIRGLLTVNPEKRLTVEQALNHPWCTKSAVDLSAHNLDGNLAVLRKYQATRKFKAGVRAVLAVNKMKNLISLSKSSSNSSSASAGAASTGSAATSASSITEV